MEEYLRSQVLPNILITFDMFTCHSNDSMYNLLCDVAILLENAPYEYMLYMAIIESLEDEVRLPTVYYNSVEYFYGMMLSE